jgi:hypothetical protein
MNVKFYFNFKKLDPIDILAQQMICKHQIQDYSQHVDNF